MAGSPEQQNNKGFTESFAETGRNAGIVVALLGAIAILATGRGWPVFVAGVAYAALSEVGRRSVAKK